VNRAKQIESVAASLARAGAKLLRGGAFKTAELPLQLQGLGERG